MLANCEAKFTCCWLGLLITIYPADFHAFSEQGSPFNGTGYQHIYTSQMRNSPLSVPRSELQRLHQLPSPRQKISSPTPSPVFSTYANQSKSISMSELTNQPLTEQPPNTVALIEQRRLPPSSSISGIDNNQRPPLTPQINGRVSRSLSPPSHYDQSLNTPPISPPNLNGSRADTANRAWVGNGSDSGSSKGYLNEANRACSDPYATLTSKHSSTGCKSYSLEQLTPILEKRLLLNDTCDSVRSQSSELLVVPDEETPKATRKEFQRPSRILSANATTDLKRQIAKNRSFRNLPASKQSRSLNRFEDCDTLRMSSKNSSRISDFADWNRDVVSAWLYEIGLGFCVIHARKWVHTGRDLINASRRDLEKDLGLKNPIYLKKLVSHLRRRTSLPVIALEALGIANMNPIPPTRNFSVFTWLEDLGLSLYRSIFDRALIDAYTLDTLSLDDVVTGMQITSELHVLSLRRGVQVLRWIQFDLNKLCRRPTLPRKSRSVRDSSEEEDLHDSGEEDMLDIDVLPSDGNNNVPIVAMSCTTKSRSLQKKSGSMEPPGKHSHLNGFTYGETEKIRRDETRRSGTVGYKGMSLEPLENATPYSASSSSGASSSGGGPSVTSGGNFAPQEICLWSHHRIVAWLESIEFAEYVAELRGSGLHGALFILEDRFDHESLAKVLHIPQSKSLLRRYLKEKFIELVGPEVWARKVTSQSTPDVYPITPQNKMKLYKKRPFLGSIRKKRSSEPSEEDLLCPVDINTWNPEIFDPEAAKIPSKMALDSIKVVIAPLYFFRLDIALSQNIGSSKK
ncbi:PTPRF interacting protein binding protein [Cichlidogyrus casuarinus]|uniref:PTPRF interacting protein binding protein n=1 Tax=Cichlidogyrus casuarinus TaxID=1844966 RepID=A0ABD2QJ33_9PLAT